MIGTLVGLGILFPIIAGLICLPIKNHKARGGIVYLTAAVLIISSILVLRQGSVPIEYSPASTWDSVILVFNYVILAVFSDCGYQGLLPREVYLDTIS